jgi:hypothetical protein
MVAESVHHHSTLSSASNAAQREIEGIHFDISTSFKIHNLIAT